jgi:transcriptional regulator with XRE-family HTH domain
VSRFGDLLRKLRRERGLTLDAVAREIKSNKGYVSGIETDKVNPPSEKVVRKIAKLFGQDERYMVWLAWTDKSPQIIRPELLAAAVPAEPQGEQARVPLLNARGMGYPLDVDDSGRVKPLVHAFLELPRSIAGDLDGALIVQEASMSHPDGRGLEPGDVALLRYEPKVRGGTDAFLLLKEGGSMLRRITVQGNRVVLQARNRNHPEKIVRKADIQAFYPVAGRIQYGE